MRRQRRRDGGRPYRSRRPDRRAGPCRPGTDHDGTDRVARGLDDVAPLPNCWRAAMARPTWPPSSAATGRACWRPPAADPRPARGAAPRSSRASTGRMLQGRSYGCSRQAMGRRGRLRRSGGRGTMCPVAGCSAARLARSVRDAEVRSSNLRTPTLLPPETHPPRRAGRIWPAFCVSVSRCDRRSRHGSMRPVRSGRAWPGDRRRSCGTGRSDLTVRLVVALSHARKGG
jgi:hypothetical protein